MATWSKKRIRKLNIATHRDLGYFFTSLILVYCISGIALNHVDDWNPDFIIQKQEIKLGKTYTKDQITEKTIRGFCTKIGEETYKVFDFPTDDQVKIYFEDASLHLHLNQGKGMYERIGKRHLFYESNILHRNNLAGWKWASDVFALCLITITITGLFVLKGKHGITGRGKWLIAAGFFPPVIALILHYLL